MKYNNPMLKKILSDPFIPALLLLSAISSLILLSLLSRYSGSSETVLGSQDPSPENCQVGKCGFCRKCGGLALNAAGDEGLNCGQLSRCTQTKAEFKCQFDLSCL